MHEIKHELPSGKIINNTTISDIIDDINRVLSDRLPEEYQTIESIADAPQFFRISIYPMFWKWTTSP